MKIAIGPELYSEVTHVFPRARRAVAIAFWPCRGYSNRTMELSGPRCGKS
jgi:hypothetical protein